MTTALEVRSRFARFWEARGYASLPEHPVIAGNGKETFFNGSAITPHLGYFDGTARAPASQLYTQQRVFWTRHADLPGHNPVWNVMQVMMSFYAFGVLSIDEHLRAMHEFLVAELALPDADLFVIVERRPELTHAARHAGFPDDRTIPWARMTKFEAGNLHGTYVRIVLRYRHGLLPIWDLIYMPRGSVLDIDSCLLLERVSFVSAGAPTWFETEMFEPLLRAMTRPGGELVDFVDARSLAVLMRSMTCALADGGRFGPKGPNHVLRRLARTSLGIADRMGLGQTSLEELVGPAIACLQHVGYDFSPQHDDIGRQFAIEHESHSRRKVETDAFLRREIERGRAGPGPVATEDDLRDWSSSRGIPIEEARSFLARAGVTVPTASAPAPDGRVFLSDLYPYDATRPILDVRQALIDMEHAYS